MARTKQTARRSQPSVVTWTRFHLPIGQEWPAWAVAHENVHFGPLNDVDGVWKGWLGRMVEDPEQAAYIIGKALGDAVRETCSEFITNLPSRA